MNQMAIVNLLLGIVLLILGRKLFWLFVGVAGFLVGLEMAERFITGPEGMKLLIAIAAGILGAVIAVFLQKVAIAIAGFVIGGYITVQLLRASALFPKALAGIQGTAVSVPYIIGGIIGAVLLFILFDWGMIVLSSLSGASLIVHNINFQSHALPWLFAVLAVVGILVQAQIKRKSRAPAGG
jgi:MFS family permease